MIGLVSHIARILNLTCQNRDVKENIRTQFVAIQENSQFVSEQHFSQQPFTIYGSIENEKLACIKHIKWNSVVHFFLKKSICLGMGI